MADSNSYLNTGKYWNKAVARWSRVCELGMEAALREAGCSEGSIVDILRQVEDVENLNLIQFKNSHLSRDERTALLATLGRGISRVNTVALGGGFSNSHKELAPDVSLNRVVIEIPCLQSTRGLSENDLAALCVNLSSNNSNIVELDLSGGMTCGTVKGCTLLGHALATNCSVTNLKLPAVHMGSDAVRCLLEGLQSNKTLEALILRSNPLSDEGVRSVAEFLSKNATLKTLDLRETGSTFQGPMHTSSALKTNTALKILMFGIEDVSKAGVTRLLQSLSFHVGIDAAGPRNKTLEKLYLEGGSMHENVDSITLMIRTNKSLRAFGFYGGLKFRSFVRDSMKGTYPMKRMFAAMKENDTLTELDLSSCPALDDDDDDKIFDSLVDLLQNSSTALEKIVLKATALFRLQGRIDEELRINKEYRSALRGRPQTAITFGRIILCGYEFAGKTEIAKTMKRIEKGASLAHPFRLWWKKLMQKHPAYKELRTRTRGFQVLNLHKHLYVKSIWDFAGQKEYHALHDYVFPHIKNSYFLYVCSCRFPPDPSNLKGEVKDEKSIKGECEYWMRFLASNSKPGGVSGTRQLPRARFVLTKTDTLESPQQITSIAKHVVCELKGTFEDVIDLWEGVDVVNAHSTTDVQRLLMASSVNLKEIMAHQKEYDVCQQVRHHLEKWSRRNPLKPVLSLDDFYSLPGFRFHQASRDYWKIILAYLNDLGEIIFPRQIDFIVTNPSWFGIDVLGSLINAFKEADLPSYSLYHDQGFVKRQDMKEHLERSLQSMDLKQSIPAEKMIDLMILLELCFENEPQQVNSLLFVPALFDDNDEIAAKGQRQLEWKLVQMRKAEYLGRRLQCQDRSTTFLTPGFFPRLQVHLRNYLHKQKWIENPFYEVGRNLIRFVENGVEVCVEYAGDTDDFIDILVKTSKPYAKALGFIEEHVVKVIRTFCASPQGCQGVVLVESVIRPVCVRDLHLCIKRKAHSILVSKLEAELDKDNDYKHTWRKILDDVDDDVDIDDLALDLLQGEGSHKRMGESQRDSLPEISSSMVSGSSSLGELPTLFYPSIEDIGILRRLETRLNLTKVIPIKLHLLCDHKDGSHKVKGQPGRTVKLNATTNGYDVPIAKLAITLLWAGVGLGASLVGASFSLPQVDSWVQSLFDVPELPALDGEMLHQMMNVGKPLMPVSEEEIVKALKRYWKVDPHTQGLKEILKLDDGTGFLKDFQLHKVVYIEADSANKVGWVCDSHYRKGLRQKILRSGPH